MGRTTISIAEWRPSASHGSEPDAVVPSAAVPRDEAAADRSKRRHGGRGDLDRAAHALLMRLIRGHTKLRRFPSGQWSVAGIDFIANKLPERLSRRGLIERGTMSPKGVWFYLPTALARAAYGDATVPPSGPDTGSHGPCAPQDASLQVPESEGDRACQGRAP